uniref:IRG-type G domain-containing protein n=1 Tax=Panagrolaimus superbus TaxID=310955 RepID=A0A914Z2N0_9BILA
MNECKNITVNLYDVPGSGTLTHDAKNYYQEKHLCAFDCLFILVQETFCKEEIEIAKEALKHNQTIAFIHSKCDIFLTNKKKQKLIKKIDQKAVDDCLNELKLNYITEIRKSKILKLQKIPCFYVNSFNLYDLKNDIISEPNVKYQEKELIEFMTSEVKYSRNIIT